jgi:hypothetical protein
MKPSELTTDTLIFIYLQNERIISEKYGQQKEIREELGRRLEPMKDKIRRGEIDIQTEGGGEDGQP